MTRNARNLGEWPPGYQDCGVGGKISDSQCY